MTGHVNTHSPLWKFSTWWFICRGLTVLAWWQMRLFSHFHSEIISDFQENFKKCIKNLILPSPWFTHCSHFATSALNHFLPLDISILVFFFFFFWTTWEQIILIKPRPSESFSLYFLRTKPLLCNNCKVVKVRKLNINKYSYLQLVFKFFQLVLHRLFFFFFLNQDSMQAHLFNWLVMFL